MAARRVTGPDGSEWTVKRTWVHRRLRWRGRSGDDAVHLLDGVDLASAVDDLPGIGVVGVILAALAAGVLLVVFVVPALVFVFELLLILLLVALGVAAKILFRRPWTIEARQPGADHAYEWKVVGWRAGNDTIDEVATLLQSTGQPTGGRRHPPAAALP